MTKTLPLIFYCLTTLCCRVSLSESAFIREYSHFYFIQVSVLLRNIDLNSKRNIDLNLQRRIVSSIYQKWILNRCVSASLSANFIFFKRREVLFR
jgi:hypothetical protein